MAQEQNPPQQIKIKVPAEISRGVYCNMMIVTHTKEEFIMNFILVSPPEAIMTARVIMSPGHMKRTISALQGNMEKYEKEIGKIEAAPEPTTKGRMGFVKP